MIKKIDMSLFMLPSSQASQSGVGSKRNIMISQKINEIIDVITDLTDRLKELEPSPAEAIPDTQTTGVNVSILNLAALTALNAQATTQAGTINKILSVMRNRKEIKP